jgi:hypothetical protein
MKDKFKKIIKENNTENLNWCSPAGGPWATSGLRPHLKRPIILAVNSLVLSPTLFILFFSDKC